MAEKVKKAAAPRKPRAAKPKIEAATTAAPKPAAKKKAAPKTATKAKVTPIKKAKTSNTRVTHEEIAILAHNLWIERGGQHGHDADDWLRAEQTLLGKAS
jgi:hypothetical protein